MGLASLGCINDALCNDFVNDCRLAPIMKLAAGIIERFAHQLGNSKTVPDFRINGRMDATLVSPGAVPMNLRRQMFWFNEVSANTKAVMFKLKFGIQPICQSPHELEAKPPSDEGSKFSGKSTPSSVTSTMNDPSSFVSQRRLTFTTKPDG